MKLKRFLAVFIAFVAVITLMPTMKANAVSDVDFTINVDTDTQYIAGDTIDVKLEMKTQTSNGFVELTGLLTYDADSLTCFTTFEDLDGYSALITDDGLQITYVSPNGERTPEGTYAIKIEFAVKTGVASSQSVLAFDVKQENVYGLDQYGNKEKGILTVSAATPKTLTIVETNDGSVGAVVASGADANFYFTTTTVNQGVGGSGGSCAKPGTVIAFIFGAMILFGAGVVVGFVLCQRRMMEYNYGSAGGFGGDSSYSSGNQRTPQRASLRTGFSKGGGFGRLTADDLRDDTASSSSGGTIYESEEPDELVRPQPRRPLNRPQTDEELVDTSYFGRAAENRIGSEPGSAASSGFEDDDDDDSFPDQFVPRRYGSSAQGGDFSKTSGTDSFDSLLGGYSRRERDDDGYGSFSVSDDEGNGGDDYRSDRRRYR